MRLGLTIVLDRRHETLINKNLTSNLVRSLCEISDVEISVKKRRGDVCFNDNVADEVYNVALRLSSEINKF